MLKSGGCTNNFAANCTSTIPRCQSVSSIREVNFVLLNVRIYRCVSTSALSIRFFILSIFETPWFLRISRIYVSVLLDIVSLYTVPLEWFKVLCYSTVTGCCVMILIRFIRLAWFSFAIWIRNADVLILVIFLRFPIFVFISLSVAITLSWVSMSTPGKLIT